MPFLLQPLSKPPNHLWFPTFLEKKQFAKGRLAEWKLNANFPKGTKKKESFWKITSRADQKQEINILFTQKNKYSLQDK
jgi:hypothetical protein